MKKLLGSPLVFILIFVVLSSGCSTKKDIEDFSISDSGDANNNIENNSDKNAYFGDLHVHTKYSFDAFIFGTTATPDDAYRYAKGQSIKHPLGQDMQLEDPLDFYAVTDHAAWLGMLPDYADTNSKVSKLDLAQKIHNINRPENLNKDSAGERGSIFTNLLREMVVLTKNPLRLAQSYLQKDKALATVGFDRKVHRSAWADIANSAERHNDPGKFTTFIAYEYTTSSFGQGNLHRNVIFKNNIAPVQPFSLVDSRNPEDLWKWMDDLRSVGVESLAIPHNSNGSNGQMFKLVDWAGNPLTLEYVEQRLRNEPLVEITQVKGTSDTHPLLSPDDEWSDFEIMNFRIASPFYSRPEGSYVRDALLRGLTLESEYNFNPYKFGLIGSSDTHTGAISDDESKFNSKAGIIDGTPAFRGSIPLSSEDLDVVADGVLAAGNITVDDNLYRNTNFIEWGASGLAGVWAEENTREAIYDAFRRKETFATTGSRIKVRFFAGYDLDSSLLNNNAAVSVAYKKGVPMGSDLLDLNGDVPSFFVWAIKDAKRASLDRVQIIKGWVDSSGKPYEKIYDVACSDGNLPDPLNNRCPENGAEVNLDDCSISTNAGASELKTVWKDPHFNSKNKAFYYVRVLENPTCRWSSWDAVKNGHKPRSDIQATIQERAWSSPIWFIPKDDGVVFTNIFGDET